MTNYKLTIPRIILFTIFIVGGIFSFFKDGFGSMDTYQIILSVTLFLVLFILIISKVIEASKKN